MLGACDLTLTAPNTSHISLFHQLDFYLPFQTLLSQLSGAFQNPRGRGTLPNHNP